MNSALAVHDAFQPAQAYSRQDAALAYRKTPMWRNRGITYVEHGARCDSRCVGQFWQFQKTNLWVCRRSGFIVHECGEKCDALVRTDEAHICGLTRMVLDFELYCHWGIDQTDGGTTAGKAAAPAQRPPGRAPSMHTAVKIASDAKRIIRSTIETLVGQDAQAAKTSNSRRRKRTLEAIRSIARDVPYPCMYETLKLRERVLSVTRCTPVLTVERLAWLVACIYDFMVRIDICPVSARRKVVTFTTTCILKLERGITDKYGTVLFPKIPWLNNTITELEAGQLNKASSAKVKCSVEEKMWTAIRAKINANNAVLTREYVFLTEDTPRVP